MPVGIVAGGYLPYTIRTRPIAILPLRWDHFGLSDQDSMTQIKSRFIKLRPLIPDSTAVGAYQFAVCF
jgi:hypothetical protein